MEKKELIDHFYQIYRKKDKLRMFFSPGRINLIGEHTDYNGGFVFPGAITFGTYGVVRERPDRNVCLYSTNFPEREIIKFSLDSLEYEDEHGWANYPKGMINYIQDAYGTIPSGFDMLVCGNIPNGAGLSSSASLELLMGVVLDELFRLNMERIEMVKLGQKTENQFIGVNSGIMDQFAVGMGKRDCGILLDCDTLQYEYAPLNLTGHKILIMNTNKRRELADSKYNERRAECEEALLRLKGKLDIQALGDLTEKQYDDHRELIADPTLKKRAKHAVYENARTIKALHSLRKGELGEFGRLMNESHISLRDDYEVTGVELDTLVGAAWDHAGTLGARMTGAGFGGCAIALVENDHVESFKNEVGRQYKSKIGYEATFYTASIGDGAKEL
ncbi:MULTISPECIES: galactokinase [Rossellomorea]|uniref:Galactokinase n=1 Tax=Rossellomorea vietnamensis TaxID=218284 RepID=A0A6I6UUK5_9BACI|nr:MULTISPECIES: galactokinase [Rossellomorea]QHE63321.1 galactokinase [Rossellomorea vietnamensis]WGG45379.1 galactokinase [Rossellomorea sp. DA94]